MQKLLFTGLLIILSIFVIASDLPATKPVTGADLQITDVRVIEAVRNEQTKLHTIKVEVGIRNNGSTMAVATQLMMAIKNAGVANVASQGSISNAWVQFGKAVAVPEIAAGKMISNRYSFIETSKVTAGNEFSIRLIVDAAKKITESNETDNFSEAVVIHPTPAPAEWVAVAPVIQVDAQIKKVDTFTLSIGKTEMRLALEEKSNEYIKIFPQGITIKSSQYTEQKSKSSIIAPINLPTGAVIRRVVFYYIVLPQSDGVPHLVLRSNYLTADGGYGINKPITSYWITSGSLNGRNGYDVKSSSSAPGLNIAVVPGSNHYFEILAGSASSTATPQTSVWPDNEKIFIWGIDVKYTLP
jgi:CARDB